MPDGKQLWFRVEVEHRLFAGFCVFDPNAESEEGHGDQVDEYDDATVKAVGHYLKISAADHKDWWATRWYLPAGEQKPNDSVPNFKIMNDANDCTWQIKSAGRSLYHCVFVTLRRWWRECLLFRNEKL